MTKRTTYRQVLNLSSNICPFSSDMVTLRFLFKEACYSQIKSDDINKVTTIGYLTLEFKVKVKFTDINVLGSTCGDLLMCRSWNFEFQIVRNLFFMNFLMFNLY